MIYVCISKLVEKLSYFSVPFSLVTVLRKYTFEFLGLLSDLPSGSILDSLQVAALQTRRLSKAPSAVLLCTRLTIRTYVFTLSTHAI
jgi:hypothetical protein